MRTTKEQMKCSKESGKKPYKVSNDKGETRYVIGATMEQTKSKFKAWIVQEIKWEEYEQNYSFSNEEEIK